MVAEFQDPETEPSVFILSLRAGGVGLNLTKANHVFHFDRWWNPAVEDQATDRAFRIGQRKNVFVHKFVAMGTVEERIDAMIEDKKRLAAAIVGARRILADRTRQRRVQGPDRAAPQRGPGVGAMAQFSRTWWGQRFIAALEQFTDPGRLGRGRSYASNGRSSNTRIADGTVTATVRGSINPYFGVYKEPRYKTTIAIAPIRPTEWTKAIDRIAANAGFVTKLLMNEMPDNIEDAFAALDLPSPAAQRARFRDRLLLPGLREPVQARRGRLLHPRRRTGPRPLPDVRAARPLARASCAKNSPSSPLGQILSAEMAPKEVADRPRPRPTTRGPSGSRRTRR